MIKILAGFIMGGAIGMAVYPAAEAMISAHAPAQSYTRECLLGDECTMRIRPKDAPWLNLTCELTNPPRCRDE